MKKLLFVLMGLLTLTNVNAQMKYSHLEDATAALRLAMLNGNGELLATITDASLSYGHSSGKIENRTSFVQSLSSGTSDFVTLEISGQTIQQYKRSAVVRHLLQAETNDNGVSGKVKLHVMQVWVKKGRAWKLVARQAVKQN